MTDEMIRLKRDDDRDLRFHGTEIATVWTSPDKSSSHYSGATGLSSALVLYRTRGGKFVAGSVGHSQWQGHRDRYAARVCETEEEVIEFFGIDPLTKRLFEQAGIDTAETIE